MKAAQDVACIGWGSLLWSPRTLPVRGEWRSDGPRLPIEFARISSDGRLTLIVWPGAAPIETYWVPLDVRDLKGAIRALARREGCTERYVAFWSFGAGGTPPRDRKVVGPPPNTPAVLDHVGLWAEAKGLAGAVWTDLPSEFEERAGEPYCIDAAIRYLARLPEGPVRRAAETYVRNAPPQTRTACRNAIERALGWTA